jgi:hypothetical protein
MLKINEFYIEAVIRLGTGYLPLRPSAMPSDILEFRQKFSSAAIGMHTPTVSVDGCGHFGASTGRASASQRIGHPRGSRVLKVSDFLN